MTPRIPIDHDRLAEFCRKHHIRKLALFGSVLRDDFRPDSDIDVLYEFEPGHSVSFFGLFRMEEELSDIFDGRKVEMIAFDSVNRWIRNDVLAQAQLQYNEG